MDETAFRPVTDGVLAQLARIVGQAHVSVTDADRELHARDQSGHAGRRCEAVVWPSSAQEVADVLRLANEQHIAVTPWGVGSSLEGNPIPLRAGIVLSTRRMQEVVAVHVDDFQVTVEPGLGYKDLNQHLVKYGLFFAPDPGANATIGGMLANNAAGIRTVKYGACRDNVLRLQVALPDGRLIHAGSRSVKQSAGYDLVHLYVGSEGTLGVITEATLRLAPIPAFTSAVVASFATVEDAVQAVVAVRGSGLDPAALEFVDAHHAQLLSQEPGVDLAPQPTLFMEFHAASQPALEIGLELVRELCQELDASSFRATADPTERSQLWHARHHAYEIARRNHPDQQFVIVDVAVPISRFPTLVAYIQQVLEQAQMPGYMIGHAGDGNLHVLLPFHDDASYRQALAANRRIVLKAIDLEGTATGEHGVGIGKARYLRHEHGAAVDLMQALKQTLDPKGIMNPGKIFAADERG